MKLIIIAFLSLSFNSFAQFTTFSSGNQIKSN